MYFISVSISIASTPKCFSIWRLTQNANGFKSMTTSSTHVWIWLAILDHSREEVSGVVSKDVAETGFSRCHSVCCSLIYVESGWYILTQTLSKYSLFFIFLKLWTDYLFWSSLVNKLFRLQYCQEKITFPFRAQRIVILFFTWMELYILWR